MALKISDTASTPNYISFGDVPPFDAAAAFSLSIIFKTNTAPGANNRLFSKNVSAAGTRSWGVYVGEAVMTLLWYESTATVGDSSVPTQTVGTWYQFVMSFDPTAAAGDKMRIYSNGVVLVDAGANPIGDGVTTTPDDNAVAFAIGKDQQTGNNGAPIDVAEFEWMDSAIVSADATAMYNGGVFKRLQDVGKSVSHYWPMTDTSATTTIEDTVGALDGTGSGITAAASHPTMWYQQSSGGAGNGLRGRSRLSLRGR
jgi:hypothetical protein